MSMKLIRTLVLATSLAVSLAFSAAATSADPGGAGRPAWDYSGTTTDSESGPGDPGGP